MFCVGLLGIAVRSRVPYDIIEHSNTPTFLYTIEIHVHVDYSLHIMVEVRVSRDGK